MPPPDSLADGADVLRDSAACFRYACAWHGLLAADVDAAITDGDLSSPTMLAAKAEGLGLAVRVIREELGHLARHGVPAILFGRGGAAWVFDPALDGHGRIVAPTAEGGSGERVEASRLRRDYLGSAMLLLPSETAAAPDGGFPKEGEERGWGWFWRVVWDHRRDSIYILAASVLISAFAVAMPLFTRSVYDRVIPNNAIETLWVLATGVAIIFAFDFVVRLLRGWFVDVAGKGIDHVLGQQIYRQALSIDLSARPHSAGSFASNLRGYETVREFLSAATVLTIVDVPVSLLLIAVVFWLGGPIGWFPVAAAVLIIGVALLLQPFLRRLMRESYARSVHRQSLMAETANGLESVKAANAEAALERRMDDVVARAETVDLRMRRISQFGTAWTTLWISLANIAVVVGSVYRIHSKEMTMGALIACSMVVGRAMTPLAGVAGLLLRLQQTMSALEGLNSVMKLPREGARAVLRKKIRHPEFTLQNVKFTYPRQPVPSLQGVSLKIGVGERVGIIGRAGAGKSTLLRLLSRLHLPTEGLVLLDGVDIGQWPGHLVRAACGYLPQDGTLFHGSIRENITLGNPRAGDEAMLAAAERACVLEWVNNHPEGFDRPVGERGILLSGGQRQSVLLARCLFAMPDVLLLDEPTDSFDLTTEKKFRAQLDAYLAEEPRRTLVLATHKPTLLQFVRRLILIENGRVLADGPKDEVLRLLQASGKPEAAEGAARVEAAGIST